MTTIVGDFRRRVMVSDSRCSDGHVWWSCVKIYECDDGIYGFAGMSSDCVQALEYILGNIKKPKLNASFECLKLCDAGLFRLESDLVPQLVEQQYMAIGSGQMAALALLNNGSTPEEAVKGAINVDAHSGGDLQTLSLKET